VVLTYDADDILGTLRSFDTARGKVVAAACADWLLRCYGQAIPAAAVHDEKLRLVVGDLWESAVRDNGYAGDAEGDLGLLEDVLSGDYGEALGVGEHVIMGLYHGVDVARSADPTTAELVTKNLYEAADYVVVADGDCDISAEGAEGRVLAAEPVQEALEYIFDVLRLCAEIDDHAARVAAIPDTQTNRQALARLL
jgi:hypothetical protein